MKNLKSTYWLFLFCLFLSASKAQDCDRGTALSTLTVGDDLILLPNNGNLWTDFNGRPGYLTKEADNPADEVGMIFSGGLWLGGFSPNGDLKVSAVTYASSNNLASYFPGPLNQNGQVTSETCANFDRQWAVSRVDIESLISDLADGILDEAVPDALLRWPAQGNPHFQGLFGFELPSTPQGLAPFFDRDGDGIYDPAKGDVPNIRAADQAIWWVFNDVGGVPGPNNSPLQMEIQAMAYSYQSSDPDINNTSFYDFKLINRASEAIDSFYATLWLDADLGCNTDDMIGCDSENNLAFVYNETDFDGGPECGDCPQAGVADFCSEIPMLGIKVLRGTNGVKNGQIVNNGMSSFTYYGLGPTTDILAMTSPNEPVEYYRYMTGSWRDGTAMTIGGSGYNPLQSAIIKYAFDGDPGDPDQWSLCTVDLSDKANRRMMISSGPGVLSPGSSTRIRFAVFKAYGNTYPCPSLDNLRAVCEKVEEWDGLKTGTENSVELAKARVSFAPNPMNDYGVIRLRGGQELLERVAIYTLDGRRLRVANNIQAKEWKVEREGWRAGMYLYRLQTTGGKWFSGKMIVR